MSRIANNPIDVSQVLIEALKPSPTNPRKHFDSKHLDDLASSIKEKGILEPLLVRAQGDEYEIVAGERRYRAAKLAGLDALPCIIRVFNDQQVVEIQVIENMQREDLTPLEEAAGYRMLTEKFKYTWDMLAKEIGKSKSYIASRLGLLSLAPRVQEELAKSMLPLSWAMEFRRIADPKHQVELLQQVLQNRIEDLADLRRLIEEDYLLLLSQADFSKTDPKLVAKAGPCSSCPKRTGAQAELFDGGSKHDTCLDAACFKSKILAHGTQLALTAKKEGRRVITGKEAEDLIDKAEDGYNSPVVLLDKKCYELRTENDPSYRSILKQHDKKGRVEVMVALDSKGRAHELVKSKDVLAVVPKEKLRATNGGQKISASESKARQTKAINNKASRRAWAATWPGVIAKLAAKPFSGQLMREALGLAVLHHMDYKAGRGPLDRLKGGLAGTGHANGYNSNVKVGNSIRIAKSDKEALTIFWHVVLGEGLSYFDPSRMEDAAKDTLKLAGTNWGNAFAKAKAEVLAEKKGKSKTAVQPKPVAKSKPKLKKGK